MRKLEFRRVDVDGEPAGILAVTELDEKKRYMFVIHSDEVDPDTIANVQTELNKIFEKPCVVLAVSQDDSVEVYEEG